MKKSRKIIIGIITGVIVCTVVGSLLGVFIPKLLNKSNINDLVKEQVIPSEGQGNFLKYNTEQAITAEPYNQKLESIENFSKKALNSKTGYETVIKGLVSNFAVEFWKNYKDSVSYKNRFDEWNKSINEEWDNTLKSYKEQYGNNWEFYFQLQILDPVGGNEDDWKRSKLVDKANSALDEYLFNNFYINALDKNNEVITNFPSPLTTSMQKYLTSPQLINGTSGVGTRNKIVFQPSANEIQSNPWSLGLAKFQEFVFMEWVKNELPLITSMTLWKHVDPLSINNNGYKYFNDIKAEQIYNGNFTPSLNTGSIPARDSSSASAPSDGSNGDSGSSSSSSNVGISASYKWQAFPVKQNLTDSATGELAQNATDKYLSFSNKFNNNGWKTNFILPNSGGAINIDVKYTDDSSTLYFIKLGGGSGSVFNTSYTQYAAGSNYKFNELVGLTPDTNVPSTQQLTIDPIVTNKSGTEIMNNFMELTKPATGFYIELPQQIQAIINDSNNAETGYVFKGLYNGVKYITDSVDISNSPFILTRNESGVHIIGIDRAQAINEGFKTKQFEGVINEIANTILWRYILTKSGMNGQEYLNNGFSSFDVPNEIKTYFTNNRNELLFKYILANEINISSPTEPLFFSSKFTTIDSKILFTNNVFKEYINDWIKYNEYNKNMDHNPTVKSKIIDLQKSANSLTFKTFGNTVIQNGIAAMQPYTRTTTENILVDNTNKGYVDNVYGMYPSLNLAYAKQKATLVDTQNPNNLSNFDLDLNGYNETELKKKLNQIELDVNAVYSSLLSEIGMKKLTFSSAKYNQYLLIGSKNPTSDRYYADNCNLINNAVSSWISNNSNSIKDILDIQRLIASTNYDPSKNPNKPTTKVASNKDDILDLNNFALTGAYSNPTTMNNIPNLPTDNTTSKDYINYYFQKSFDILNKIPNVTANLYEYQNGKTYDQLLTLARNNWVQTLLKDPYSSPVLEFIKQVIGLKYAFDFNPETGQYEFIKFRNYLVQQTENNRKAAFVWTKTDRNDLIQNYETQTLDQRFAYKNYQVISNNDINGYMYQNAPGLNQYKDLNTNQFLSSVTFNETASNYIVAPLTNTTGSSGYSGYQGMVFESSTPGDLPADAKTALFSNELNIFVNQDAPESINQGSMYNIGNYENLRNEVKNSIYTWDTLIKTCYWLNNTFDINTNIVNQQPDLAAAKNKVLEIMDTAHTNNVINDSLFTRNKGVILANGSSLFNKSSKYFGDKTIYGGKMSQIVFTQFNYYDVVKLFDTNNDTILDEKDKGLNWATIQTEGFLGVSADAFFISAMQWFNTQSSYITTATKKAQDLQGKFEAFDRRLNNLFGKDMISNYKKEN